METKTINVALIASGGGTDATAIMLARNYMAEANIKLLISTKKDAGCLGKARVCGVPSMVIDRQDLGSSAVFDRRLAQVLRAENIQLVFLVGCIVKIPVLENITYYNIHPANMEKYGGKGMYGLEPHKKVLSDIYDLLHHRKKSIKDRFYTEVTIHEVEDKYDSGPCLIKLQIEIPINIIIGMFIKKFSITESAVLLRQHVLPYEWLILPTAVKIAAHKLLTA